MTLYNEFGKLKKGNYKTKWYNCWRQLANNLGIIWLKKHNILIGTKYSITNNKKFEC